MKNSLSSGLHIVRDTTFWSPGVPTTPRPIKPLPIVYLSLISLVTFRYSRLVIIAQVAAHLILKSTASYNSF